ncbi:uncharacterized protein LOC125765072, partial [Anopheles funestus]|uniref:uncharacterized protein LOC125765072 n=1 Tax=Anopheles funestus TaxID=62324 RepID=UPI0020C70695
FPINNQINKFFQSESPELCRLHGDVSRLYRTILDNFLASEYIAGLNELSKVVFCQQNYKPLEEMYIGTESMLLMEQHLQSRTLNQQIATEVRTNMLNLYVTLCNQINKRIDLSDPIIIQSARLDPKNWVVPALLSLPHSTACVERLFSQCNQNRNKLKN